MTYTSIEYLLLQNYLIKVKGKISFVVVF